MWAICHRDEVRAEDPMASGRYALRVPHHLPELQQMNRDAKEAGIVIPVEAVLSE